MTKMPYTLQTTKKANMTCKAYMLLALFLLLTALPASAQITIGGNVYGGGNEGDTEGNTNVTIRKGRIKNVFGGARMADVGGRAFVNIDGDNGSGVILIASVYGGNDISGTVGTNVDPDDHGLDKLPKLPDGVTPALKDVLAAGETKTDHPEKNAIDNSWVAYVRSSPMKTEGQGQEDDTHCILVGSVYGGGNGDYTYTDASGNPLMEGGKYIAKSGNEIIATSTTPFTAPTLTKTYLEIDGGCLSQVYGGGNYATVTVNTTISMNNPSKGLQSLYPGPTDPPFNGDQAAYRKALMQQLEFLSNYTGIPTFQGDYTSLDYTSSRVFGGNNKAEMRIRPVWNLQRGKLRDLYSGGNEGNMTNPEGLILDINPLSANSNYLSIVNVYGGCRRADVRPTIYDGNNVSYPTNVQLPNELGYHFPAGLPARTVVRGGKVTNVYGGNDISGRVFGGNAVGIYTTVYGDVYGGGNGSYSYTDNATLGALPGFKDFYYNPDEVEAKERQYSGDNNFSLNSTYKSVEALNIFRPNAEQVSILVRGTETNPTIIRGSVYLGGNSASLKTENSTLPSGQTPKVELKIGSHAIIDKVFLGNNGANMVTEDILKLYAGSVNTSTGALDASGVDFSGLTLTDKTQFAKYMEGCAMSIHPSVVFENTEYGDPQNYIQYSSQIGSFFCGGNRGSMTWPGTNTINFDKKVIIFDKFVGGCNDANIVATTYNAEYLGGMIGSPAEQAPGGMEDENHNIKDCMVLNFSGLKVQPKRWKQTNGVDDLDANNNPQLEWNTFNYTTGLNVTTPSTTGEVTRTGSPDDFNRRLRGGNIYGGCYNSGHMKGNVVINLKDDIVDLTGPYAVFDIVTKENPLLYQNDKYTIDERHSGVILDEQGMDPLGLALNVYGGGYGPGSEVWGSATVNLRAGHTFQIFGGGQQGPIGKSLEDNGLTSTSGDGSYEFNGKHYKYDARYSTYVNMEDDHHVAGSATADIPETQFIYGGSFEAPIMGNTHVYLGNGRAFNSFAGSCNADILGHTETYVGKSINRDGTATDGQIIESFPYIIDHIYGGNDLGGKILGEIRAEQNPSADDAQQALADCNFKTRVKTLNGEEQLTKVYKYNASTNPNPSVLTASAYIEYTAGHVVNIFGGAYGDYDYTAEKYRAYCNADGSNKDGFSKPRLGNAFINFKPVSNNAVVSEVYGAGQGRHAVIDRDVMQERSYILVDIPQNMTRFENTVFFGGGAYGGVGMEKTPDQALANPDKVSAVIDLFRGQIKNVYGGSYKEGVTRRSVVNVPAGSTIAANNIFGGAYGIDNRYACDVYESHANYNSGDAQVSGALYGGNNNARRTIYANVNVTAPVWSNKSAGYQATVYGAGLGADTWAEYTDLTLGNGAVVYKAFAGGNAGQVLNLASVEKKKLLADAETDPTKTGLDLTIGAGYTNNGLENALAAYSVLADDVYSGITKDAYHKKGGTKEKYNTNVHVLTGALVTGYAYGGGLGETATVSGTTYIDVLGGTVDRDIYAGGQGGSVRDLYGLKTFTATANAYVKSGTVRNAYGGGYLGSVGYHPGAVTDATTSDVLARTNVVVGANPASDAGFANGIPAVKRNAYGGGEGGSIYGSSHITVNNGYIGYRYEGGSYKEELDDPGLGENASTNAIKDAGNAFGGGYIANSYVDTTYVYMYGGHLRGSIFGGGEIGPIGRGTKIGSGGAVLDMPTIAMGGQTHIYLYKGHVHRSVFGGGRGYDSWGGDGTKFMTQAQIDASDFNTKGFVFGSTDVNIRGGIVGTSEGVGNGLDGDGNVFGGGDVGYVYSATGRKVGSNPDNIRKDSQNDDENGLPIDGGGYYYKGGVIANGMTVDCFVDVAPYCQVKAGQTLTLPKLSTDDNGNFVRATTGDNKGYPVIVSGETVTFNEYDYVPLEYLNLLNKGTGTYGTAAWGKIDYESGITIHNAVFAGGNVSVGSDQVFVNSNTVFGNATAALRDVYHRDLITVGTERIGGLYGDGNLTFVDGFRELTISNYGTDFYGLSDKITVAQYHGMNDRERAYFQLEYECQQNFTYNEITYQKDSRLKESEYEEIFKNTTYYNNELYWKEAGFCSIYAGRLLNTVQRADFVGVWGSRMVLQGARDRVPEKADYTNYTINRVGEVSLNCTKTQCSEDTAGEDKLHGNYFGIYNIVNYLGNLTSDVTFNTVRVTDTDDEVGKGDKITVGGKPYGEATYWDWKKNLIKEKNRNNGTSKNMVALASGVYLELINESSATSGTTDWGYITGIVELDLINVMQGLGGGYVYAKNEHGEATHHPTWSKVTMSPYNLYAVTYKRYTYADVTATDEVESSGNFIHNTKTIIDDCYPIANSFYGTGKVAAHYWYIKGSIYVYDQYISAFTGSATAYSKNISLPLTITANAHGKLTMTEVQPNLYAYYSEYNSQTHTGTRLGLGENDNFVANNVTYRLNDPITYWDWQLLSDEDKNKFVPETYTVIDNCMINGTPYPRGYTMLEDEYDDFTGTPEVKIKDVDTDNYVVDPAGIKDFDYMVRLSNNLSHNTGYVLTYKVDNPMVWDDYFTKNDLSAKVNTKVYDAKNEQGTYTLEERGNYIVGPTYRLTDSTPGVFGQKEYKVGDIIDQSIQTTYTGIDVNYRNALQNQATFVPAYVVTQELIVDDNNGNEHHIYPGVPIVQSDFSDNWSSISSKVAPALVITSTLELTASDYLYAGDLYSVDQLKAYIKEAKGYTDDDDVDAYYDANISYYANAYYCTSKGKYGGSLFSPNVAYPAIDAWSSMSQEDQAHFAFNYDALDLLIDPTYANIMTRYDGTNDPKIYSPSTPIDYQAKLTGATSISYTKPNSTTTVTITNTQELSREEYEAIPNERYHYAPISVTGPATYYVVKQSFIRGDSPYSVGQVISADLFGSLSPDQKLKVDQLDFSTLGASATQNDPMTFYYCRNPYMVNEKGEGVNVTNAFDTSETITSSTANGVPLGFVITETNYESLPNKTVDDTNGKQLFTIYGRTPLETSTLIVSRESDILDLTKEKTITVMFTYEYEESDESGMHITPVTERHIVNIHLQFKSGVPEIGQLQTPPTVLPGTTVGLKVPNITPGAFEVLGSGWEIFTNQADATSHKNGQPYVNNDTKMYWYQDGYYVAYYAKTYLGKTYSNSVEFDVANYHDLDQVMQDKENHMFLDHQDAHRQRDPKIYIDNRDCTSDATKNELDLLKDFFDLT
ncbi:MAG: hypothetical protein K6G92_08760, partial [Bacteroidaceae bacterium]|nr:hypothetical protein [Bacteroidaceae bacterium]